MSEMHVHLFKTGRWRNMGPFDTIDKKLCSPLCLHTWRHTFLFHPTGNAELETACYLTTIYLILAGHFPFWALSRWLEMLTSNHTFFYILDSDSCLCFINFIFLGDSEYKMNIARQNNNKKKNKQSFSTENKTNVIHFVLADRTLTNVTYCWFISTYSLL